MVDAVLTHCRPTCLFLAAKTTNYPVPIDVFVQKIAKLQPSDVLDTEFLVAQSLAFEFWVRGAEKALRGWGLEFQVSAAGVGEARRGGGGCGSWAVGVGVGLNGGWWMVVFGFWVVWSGGVACSVQGAERHLF
jgi:cyclin H